MVHRIEVGMKSDLRDPAGEHTRDQLLEDLGISVDDVRVIDVYTIEGDLQDNELEQVRTQLFTDPVIQESTLDEPLADDYQFLIEVGFLPGVTDNIGKSAALGVADVIGRTADGVYKSTQYAVRGLVGESECDSFTRDLLANELIQRWVIHTPEEVQDASVTTGLDVPIVTDVSDSEVHTLDLEIDDVPLLQMSKDNMYALELDEMKAIQAHYREDSTKSKRSELGLPEKPTDIELEIIAQTWSEHCKHKIFAADIEYTDTEGNTRKIDGLFRNYVKATTDKVGEKVGWLVSVFDDNAGIVRFNEKWNYALKAETHNSPSALDPYGGAITGIVGVNRDILGAGMGCKCIFNTDVFCVASPYYEGEIPARLFHPKRVLRGVHAGVRDGGNQSGIPNANGAIVFHDRFLGKPLVFCGTGGLIPITVDGNPTEEKEARPGDVIVMLGGKIGKDGIHGATFSSEELHEGSPATAVQIGDPITQKKMSDFIIEARDKNLYSSITDNGAGGLSSSIGEMAREPGGASIHLDKAPLKYPGLAPWEIFLSEAQERMSLAVPPAKVDALLALAAHREVEATALGEFTNSGQLECFYEGDLIGSLDMEFLHNGVPTMQLKAKFDHVEPVAEELVEKDEWTQDLLDVMASLNVCSKEALVRMYDHEVQGNSVLKQFQGEREDGPGNASVIKPDPDSSKGIAVACGITPKYSELDAYKMMASAVDEAVRNLVCVGAKLGTIAGLDNFCWPDPVESEKTPDGQHKLAQLVECCEALYDTCVAYDIPLISGKDSMKNDYKIGDTKISIPPTVLFTASAVLDDVSKTVSMDAKKAGDRVYVLGKTKHELGGSEYLALQGQLGATAPEVDVVEARDRYGKLHDAIQQGLVASCHDCSDGGLAVALAETALAGDLGMDLNLHVLGIEDPAIVLFSESQSRLVVTVPEEHIRTFEDTLGFDGVYLVGQMVEEPRLTFKLNGQIIVNADIEAVRDAWQRPLDW